MCVLAKEFEALVRADNRFEVVGSVKLGLVCFRAKVRSLHGPPRGTPLHTVFQGTNEINEELLKAINKDRRIHLVPAQLRETYVLRMAICSSLTKSDDVTYAWKVIKEVYGNVIATNILENGHVLEG